MSFILDALGRKPAKPANRGDGRAARAGHVLAALGYPRRAAKSKRRLGMLLLCGVAAIGFGFAGMTAVVLFFAPPVAEQRPVQSTPSIQNPTDLPSTPAAPPSASTPADRPRLSEPRSSAPDHRRATAAAPRVIAAPPAVDHFDLALEYQRAGDVDKALVEYQTLLARNDASAEVHDNLGLLYADRGEADEAMRQFRRAIEIDPKSVKAHNNLGVALMRSGKLNEAAAHFRTALDADPPNVEPLVNLALVQKAIGRADEAKELLQRAVRLDPANAGSHYNLAVVADEIGDTPTAIDHYRAFLRYAAGSSNQLAAQVRARLAALGG
ncbi:MAG TPA: tetratricopeptide repeat protein [Vicinamibacterales bacterium]